MAENKKSNQADAYMESMKAYQKTYDFLLYLYPILSQFPKFEKFALQSQIKTAVFEMLKSVIRFRKTGTKSHIYNADVELRSIEQENDRIRMYHWRNNRSRKEWKLEIMLALPILFWGNC